jgi:exonuclease SbcC
MRPLRLLLDGFGSYRHLTEADFSDVDFFALTGPTGSGKSTLIDGLCFALYGTVPRWGKENAIAHALAPAANSCKVSLVFETAGKRYAAVRALSRDAKGRVHTKEARLERLDPAIAADAPAADILAASVEQIAEGPDLVKARIQDILGLTYEHFTQSVLLPQGRFAEFLHAKAADRQDLLVELLAYGVYARVGQRARERGKLAADRMRNASREREELAGATEEALIRAAGQVEVLARLESEVESRLGALAAVTEQATGAARQAGQVREEAGLLAPVRTPAGVPGLARRIAAADQHVADCVTRRDQAEAAEADAERARDALPDRSRLEAFRQAHADRRELAVKLTEQEAAEADASETEARHARELAAAEEQAGLAQAALEAAQNAHAAAHLASGLHVGGECPVCLQPIGTLPQHPVPASLGAARTAASEAVKRRDRARGAHDKAAKAAVVASSTRDATRQQFGQVAAALAEAPGKGEISATLEAIGAADDALRVARAQARERRTALATATDDRTSLGGEERQAWSILRESRDSVVSLGAPAVEGTDLAAAWDTLASWGAVEHAQRLQRQPELEAAAAALQRQASDEAAGIAGLLAGHGITGLPEPGRAAAAVAARRAQADGELRVVRQNLDKASRLDRQITGYRDEERVATMLGNLLKATSFERWLCGEALDSLMTEASRTLMELSGGQYQLDRDDRNDLIVIDYQDAAARRPVHTLSGGETFQASLALALALSRQVIGLSGGMRDLSSIFLDEGFGTLDEDTLETVATTLEQLAADSDRMVGVITHVPALAERAPVRFVVSRAGGTSTIRKERA